MPDGGKLPWIPREYLSPMIEYEIAIGTVSDYDQFLKTSTGNRNCINSWSSYLDYAKKMYEYVTKTPFYQKKISYQNKNIELENQYYIFKDTSIFAAKNIINLYTYLETHSENALYTNITNITPSPTKPYFDASNHDKMKQHLGQMGGEYPLSQSQRESIHTFTDLKEGEVLAVSGPPGTGKTTLLQSVVANMLVHHALKGEKAPIIVASSTNNQAVTNIISSFEKITPIGLENLEHRWICSVKNFATYFPAMNKIEEAQSKKYQYTNNRGENFFYEIEGEKNRKKSKELFCHEYERFFNTNLPQNVDNIFEKLKVSLATELQNVDTIRKKCFNKVVALNHSISNQTFSEYILILETQIQDKKNDINTLNEQIKKLRVKRETYFLRIQEWKDSYAKLPLYWKVFSFLPYIKQKYTSWSYSFMKEEELDFLLRGMQPDEIEPIYLKQIDENDISISSLKTTIHNIENEIEELECIKINIQRKHQDIIDLLQKLNKYHIFSNQKYYQIFDRLNVNEINEFFDYKIRYVEFWLAVHYYECEWLTKELPLTDRQKGKTFQNVLEIFFERIAMISPCMVMTFFMLPKNFLTLEKHYMINYIDLLIVDEAGQISPEIAAASFSLAKKAIVVGDEKQIPPVWGTEEILDITMAIANHVIQNASEFKILQDTGLNCSQSSIMKVAAKSCFYKKYERGLFLSEHRRCYNEIVKYCNDLVYDGKLIPMRGSFYNKNNPLAEYLPAMGHKEISVSYSKSTGVSRSNEIEAQQIVIWLQENYPILLKKYENNNPNEILGIISPFKAQITLIKKELQKKLPEYEKKISVGTVHSFQGAEYKVIIFSSVYGNQDGCSFINQTSSLMNVAVSRAKDSFLVFGDSGCLIGGSNEAGPMLKKATIQSI